MSSQLITDDGGTELTEKAAPRDAEQVEQPAAEDTTEETQYTIHDEAVAATFHQLAGTEASQTSKKEWKNNTHNLYCLIGLYAAKIRKKAKSE